jgi:hypothetical protein
MGNVGKRGMHSIVPFGLERSALECTGRDLMHTFLIPPFKPHFHAEDLQHSKILKVTKTLEINKA